jgi:hypothetical protein
MYFGNYAPPPVGNIKKDNNLKENGRKRKGK